MFFSSPECPKDRWRWGFGASPQTTIGWVTVPQLDLGEGLCERTGERKKKKRERKWKRGTGWILCTETCVKDSGDRRLWLPSRCQRRICFTFGMFGRTKAPQTREYRTAERHFLAWEASYAILRNLSFCITSLLTYSLSEQQIYVGPHISTAPKPSFCSGFSQSSKDLFRKSSRHCNALSVSLL